MKEELNKGVFWGAGVGIGLSVIILVWWLGIYVYEKNTKPEVKISNFVATKEITIKNYTTRLASEQYEGEFMLITGHINGHLPPPKLGQATTIRFISTLYDNDGIYLQRCYEDYSYEVLFTERHGTFKLKCGNINEKVNVKSIEFIIETETVNSEL